jgi:hypothetical protein
LQPVNRRIWVEAGEVAIAKVNWKREWLWLYAFVQPQTGETYWWLLPHPPDTIIIFINNFLSILAD